MPATPGTIGIRSFRSSIRGMRMSPFIRLVAYCFNACFTQLGVESAFELELVKS